MSISIIDDSSKKSVYVSNRAHFMSPKVNSGAAVIKESCIGCSFRVEAHL